MKKVIFPSEETWHPNKRVVVFPAVAENKKINCEITYLALKNSFGANLSDPLRAFKIKRRFIESRAKIAISNHWFEADGTIRLTTSDCLYLGDETKSSMAEWYYYL